VKNFRSFELAKQFHREAGRLRLERCARDHLKRASLSIALNLAEGRGKRTRREQVRFFHIALGSARECQAILELADEKDPELEDLLDHLGASIYKLIRHAK